MKPALYDIKDRFAQQICDNANRDCNDLQRFPGYFWFKKFEALLVADKMDLRRKESLLEIGCGTGFQSALLASCCSRIISTDLLNFSKVTHTIGINSAREMTSRLGIDNIDHLSCSAVNLPFKEKSFGCVFASSVLEHIDNRKSALMEMKRVLKDDGIVVCTVPTYMESIFQFPALYFYILKRLWDIIKNKLLKKRADHRSIFFNDATRDSSRNVGELVGAFFQNNPSFPFPEPHGDWRDKNGKQSIFVEFYQQLPWKWNKMFVDSGLKVEKSFAVLFIPYRIIEIFSPRLLTKIYCNTQFLHRKLGNSFLKYFSISICYVAKKA